MKSWDRRVGSAQTRGPSRAVGHLVFGPPRLARSAVTFSIHHDPRGRSLVFGHRNPSASACVCTMDPAKTKSRSAVPSFNPCAFGFVRRLNDERRRTNANLTGLFVFRSIANKRILPARSRLSNRTVFARSGWRSRKLGRKFSETDERFRRSLRRTEKNPNAPTTKRQLRRCLVRPDSSARSSSSTGIPIRPRRG